MILSSIIPRICLTHTHQEIKNAQKRDGFWLHIQIIHQQNFLSVFTPCGENESDHLASSISRVIDVWSVTHLIEHLDCCLSSFPQDSDTLRHITAIHLIALHLLGCYFKTLLKSTENVLAFLWNCHSSILCAQIVCKEK